MRFLILVLIVSGCQLVGLDSQDVFELERAHFIHGFTLFYIELPGGKDYPEVPQMSLSPSQKSFGFNFFAQITFDEATVHRESCSLVIFYIHIVMLNRKVPFRKL